MILLEAPSLYFESVFPAWDQEMSAQVQQPPPELPRPKKRLHRRANACEPCRASKLGCNGETPCYRCGRRRDKPECVYRVRPSRGRADIAHSNRSESQSSSASSPATSEGPLWDPLESGLGRSSYRGPPNLLLEGVPYGTYSLARCIDLYKSLSHETQSSAERDAIRKCTGIEAFDDFREHGIDQLMTGPVEASRLHAQELPDLLISEKVVQDMSPGLVTLYKSITNIRHLIHTGCLVKAWLDVIRLVKITETICGMGQQNLEVRNALEPEAVELRRRIWWLVLDVEIQISMHVGQPLNVSTRFLDGVERPTLDGLDDDTKHLESSKLDFRQAALDVLGKIDDDVHAQVAAEGYESIVELINLDRLHKMQERVPQQPLITGNSLLHVAIADHRIEFFAFKMLLACVLASVSQKQAQSLGKGKEADPATGSLSMKAKQGKHHRKQDHEYQKDVLDAAIEILKNFEILYQMQGSEETGNWTRCFAAYSAVCILAIAVLRREKSVDSHYQTINKVQAIFSGLSGRNPSFGFTKKASIRIAALSAEIRKLKPRSPTETSHGQRLKIERSPAIAKPPRGVQEPPMSPGSKRSGKKRKSSLAEATTAPESKRKRLEVDTSPRKSHVKLEGPPSGHTVSGYARSQTMHQLDLPLSQPDDLMHSSTYMGQYNSAGFIGCPSSLEDSSPGEPVAAPCDTNEDYPYLYSWFNPPLLLPNPPLLYPERSYIAQQYDLAGGGDVGFGYDQFSQTAALGQPPTVRSMGGAEYPANVELPPAWNQPLQAPEHFDISDTHSFPSYQDYAGSRPNLGRHNSVPHIFHKQMNAPTPPPNLVVASQAMERSLTAGLPHDESPSHALYPGMTAGTELPRQQNRPPISRNWSHQSSTGGYNVQHVFQPLQEQVMQDGRH